MVLGYLPRQRWTHHIELIQGISFDERQRQRIPQEKFQTNHYPLVEAGWTRQDCLDFCKEIGVTPPRSACIMCPYRSKKEWREMKESAPKEFEAACAYDESLRKEAERMGTSTGTKLPQYVSPELIPLREVDLGVAPKKEDLWQNISMQDECSGMCGV